MRIPQEANGRGSLKWLQRTVSLHPELLTDGIRAATARTATWTINWVSPRQDDQWAEYRDASFLGRVGQHPHIESLREFWPSRGPQWDALGMSSDGGVVLVEAKAHVAELISTCGAGAASLSRICRSLDGAKAAFGSPLEADWLAPYYQYANRLAHLHFLGGLGVPSILAFVYFVGDSDMKGPATPLEWEEALRPVYNHLGISGSLGRFGVCNIYIDVGILRAG